MPGGQSGSTFSAATRCTASCLCRPQPLAVRRFASCPRSFSSSRRRLGHRHARDPNQRDERQVRHNRSEQRELDFYRSRTLALSRLRGAPVELNGRRLGPLRDVVMAEDGRVVAAIVDKQRIPFDDGLRFALKRRTAA